jgi:hypothetical protein
MFAPTVAAGKRCTACNRQLVRTGSLRALQAIASDVQAVDHTRNATKNMSIIFMRPSFPRGTLPDPYVRLVKRLIAAGVVEPAAPTRIIVAMAGAPRVDSADRADERVAMKMGTHASGYVDPCGRPLQTNNLRGPIDYCPKVHDWLPAPVRQPMVEVTGPSTGLYRRGSLQPRGRGLPSAIAAVFDRPIQSA